jgi:hypothetical protein
VFGDLTYPACNVRASYDTVNCGLSCPTIFSTLSYERHDFRKNIKCVFFFISFTTSVPRISQSKKNSTRYRKCTYACYPNQMLMKIGFSQQIVKKYSNINFRENPYSWSRVVPCRRMMKLIVTFGNLANAPGESKVVHSIRQ